MVTIIYCSQCFDELKIGHFNTVKPQSICAICGRGCLGYVVFIDA